MEGWQSGLGRSAAFAAAQCQARPSLAAAANLIAALTRERGVAAQPLCILAAKAGGHGGMGTWGQRFAG